MTSQCNNYVYMFCFNLLYPETALKILNEPCIPASHLRSTMIVNEQVDVSEVLLFWNTEWQIDYQSILPCISVSGFCVVKSRASLKFLCKMCIKKYYSRDYIFSAELPKHLKQYLLAWQAKR